MILSSALSSRLKLCVTHARSVGCSRLGDEGERGELKPSGLLRRSCARHRDDFPSNVLAVIRLSVTPPVTTKVTTQPKEKGEREPLRSSNDRTIAHRAAPQPSRRIIPAHTYARKVSTMHMSAILIP